MAAAGAMVNALLMVEVRPPLAAVRFFDPERLMLKSLNVAKPKPFVNCVVDPLRVPVPVVSKRVIETPAVVTSLPEPSRNCTVTFGLIIVPAVAFDGCWEKNSWEALLAEIVNVLLTAEVRPVLDAVKFFDPTRLILRSLKVATPDAFVVRVVVPDKTPVPDVSDIKTDTPDVGTLLPRLSCN